MMQNKSKTFGVLFVLIGVAIIGILLVSCPSALEDSKKSCYYTLCFNLMFLLIVWAGIFAKRESDILEPIVFVTVLYALLYYITPIICLLSGDISWFGLDLWAGCKKGTFYATVGYLFFLLGYFLRGRYIAFNNGSSYNEKDDDNEEDISLIKGSNILVLNIIFWLIGFAASVILILSTGKSFSYIFTLADSSASEITSSSDVLFLGVIAHIMLPAYLYIFIISKSKLIKIILFYLMAMTYIIRGFRFILVAVILAPIVLYYLRNKKRPRFFQVFVVLILLFIMIGVVGIARTDIRNGLGIRRDAISTLSVESIKNILINYFSIFKNYYGIIEAFPEKMGFTGGQQIILYTLIMFVPRAIWPGKPDPVNYQVVGTAISDYARKAGSAPPNLAEFYHEFGFVGIIVCMFIFGILCKKLYARMLRMDIHSNIAYAAIYPLLLQIVIRGYTPSNFYLILVVLIPIWTTKGLIRRQVT